MDTPSTGTPISRTSLDEFKAIWRKRHGETLSDDEAADMAGRLLAVVAVLDRVALRIANVEEVRTASNLTDRAGAPYDERSER